MEINKPLAPAQPAASPRQRAVFGGTPARVAAFTLDALLFYMGGMLLDRVERIYLVELNPWLPWIGYVIVYLYFWISQSPAGKGATFGKTVMHLRVVGPDGNPLGWKPAALRALFQTLVFGAWSHVLVTIISIALSGQMLPASYADYLAYALDMPAESWRIFIFLSAMLGKIGFVLGVSELLAILIHPRHQAWHDALCGSYVTGATAPTLAEAAAAPYDPAELTSLKQYKLTLPIVSLLCMMIMLAGLTKQLLDGKTQSKLTEVIANQEMAPPGYALMVLNDPTDTQEFLEQSRRANEGNPAALPDAAVTTATLPLHLGIDQRTNQAVIIRVRGSLEEPLKDPAFQKKMDALRGILWERSERRRAEANAKAPEVVPVAEHFQVFNIEPFQVFGFSHPRIDFGIRGPADPAKGPIAFALDDKPSHVMPFADDKVTSAPSAVSP